MKKIFLMVFFTLTLVGCKSYDFYSIESTLEEKKELISNFDKNKTNNEFTSDVDLKIFEKNTDVLIERFSYSFYQDTTGDITLNINNERLKFGDVDTIIYKKSTQNSIIKLNKSDEIIIDSFIEKESFLKKYGNKNSINFNIDLNSFHYMHIIKEEYFNLHPENNNYYYFKAPKEINAKFLFYEEEFYLNIEEIIALNYSFKNFILRGNILKNNFILSVRID